MNSADDEDDDVTAGVLFVHGIGQQRPGETLAQACDALVNWFTQWTQGRLERDLDWDSGPAARIEELDLTPADGAPANGRIILRIPGKPKPVRLVVAESRWADSFRAPSFREVAAWGLLITPWAIMCHFGKRLALATFGILERERAGRRTISAVAGMAIPMLGLTLALLVTAPILLLAELVLLVLGLVPIPKIRPFVVEQQRRLTATVGDTAVFLRRPSQEAAIVSKVRRDLEWLVERSQRQPVLLVAHSQGAAVSHEALRRGSPAELSGFVTFGSGLSVLGELKHGGAGTAPIIPYLSIMGVALMALWAILWFPRPIAPLGAVWPALGPLLVVLLLVWIWTSALGSYLRSYVLLRRTAADGQATSWNLSPTAERTLRVSYAGFLGLLAAMAATFPAGLLLLPATIGIVAGLAHPSVSVWTGDWLLSRRQLSGAFEWIDFFATADPVSNGPFRDFQNRGELANRRYPSSTTEVHNRASWFFDHTIYWSNADQFVTAIAREIARVGRFDLELLAGDSEWIQVARKRRQWRVRWLSSARKVAWLTALVTLVPSVWSAATSRYFDNLDLVPRGSDMAVRLNLLAEATANRLADLHLPAGTLLAHGTLLLLVLAAYGIVCASWLAWNQSEMTRFFSRGDRGRKWAGYTAMPPWFVVFALLFAAFAFGALWLVAGRYFTQWGATATVVTLGIPTAGLLVFHKPIVARWRRASCSGPLPIGAASASAMCPSEVEVALQARTNQIIDEIARLRRVEEETRNRPELTESQCEARLMQLGKQWQALAHECLVLLAACRTDATKKWLRQAAESLLSSAESMRVSEDRLKYFRERFGT